MKFSLTQIYFAFVLLLGGVSLFYIPKKDPVVVTPVHNLRPEEYKIYEIIADREALNLKVEIPYLSDMKVTVLDPTDKEIQKLIDEKDFPSGVYNIKCRLNDAQPGNYKCKMETNNFIYETDFVIQ